MRDSFIRDGRFWGGVLLAVVSIVAYLLLALSGNENLESARGVFLFSTPFIAILIGAPVIEDVRAAAKQAERQTNGALTAKINNAVEEGARRALQLHNNQGDRPQKINSTHSTEGQ